MGVLCGAGCRDPRKRICILKRGKKKDLSFWGSPTSTGGSTTSRESPHKKRLPSIGRRTGGEVRVTNKGKLPPKNRSTHAVPKKGKPDQKGRQKRRGKKMSDAAAHTKQRGFHHFERGNSGKKVQPPQGGYSGQEGGARLGDSAWAK